MIRTRLILLAIVSLALALLVGLTLFLAASQLSSPLKNNKSALAMVRTVADMEVALHGYLVENSRNERQQWLALHGNLNSQLAKFRFDRPELNQIVQQLINRVGSLLSLFWKVEAGRLDLMDATGEQKQVIETQNGHLIGELMLASTDLVSFSYQLSEDSYDQLEHLALRATYTIMILVGGMAAFFLAAVWWLSRTLIHPLGELRRGAEVIGQGDLKHRIKSKRRDELGQLAQAFNNMAVELAESHGWLVTEIAERRQTEVELKEAQLKFT